MRRQTYFSTFPAYARAHRGGMARLSWPGGSLRTEAVTHPSNNRARRTVTSLIESSALPLCQSLTTFSELHNGKS